MPGKACETPYQDAACAVKTTFHSSFLRHYKPAEGNNDPDPSAYPESARSSDQIDQGATHECAEKYTEQGQELVVPRRDPTPIE
jgi:hypothetical protein